MEKINIAELLKNCPKGMELDCTIFDGCIELVEVRDNDTFPIYCRIKDSYGAYDFHYLTKYGCWLNTYNAKCVIFPKGKTTWEGFQRPFKDGDILFVKSAYNWILIYKESKDKINMHKYAAISSDPKDKYIVDGVCPLCEKENISEIRFATKEEKEKLFKAIENSGYKWNEETKTLEKLVEIRFKVGNIIQDAYGYKVKITHVCPEDECYVYNSLIANGEGSIDFKEQDNWKLVPNKFDIKTLKSFESKVLVRIGPLHSWKPAIFGCIERGKYCFVTLGGVCWAQCIPFEGNEHLLGKNDACDDYYKTWMNEDL